MVIVLSQFWTFTVVTLISITVPSAPLLFISIQSPRRTISCAANCMDAMNPNMVSLNTRVRIAADVAKLTSSVPIGILKISDMAAIAPIM